MKVLTFVFLTLCFFATSAFTTTNNNPVDDDDMVCDPTGCYNLGGPLEIVWICDGEGNCDPHEV